MDNSSASFRSIPPLDQRLDLPSARRPTPRSVSRPLTMPLTRRRVDIEYPMAITSYNEVRVNLCGMSLNRPETVLNLVQNVGRPVDTRTPEQVKAHLIELQRACGQSVNGSRTRKSRNHCHRHQAEVFAVSSSVSLRRLVPPEDC